MTILIWLLIRFRKCMRINILDTKSMSHTPIYALVLPYQLALYSL